MSIFDCFGMSLSEFVLVTKRNMAVVLENLTKYRESGSNTLSVEEPPINPSNIEYDDLDELKRMISGLGEKIDLLEYKEDIALAFLWDLFKAAFGKNIEMPKELLGSKKRLTQRIQNLDDKMETHQVISKKIQESVEEARINPSNIEYVDMDKLKSLGEKIGLFEYWQDVFIAALWDLCEVVGGGNAEMPEELEIAKKGLAQLVQSLDDKMETREEISKNIEESADKTRINPSNIEYDDLDEPKSVISGLDEKVGLLEHKQDIVNAALWNLCKVVGVNNAETLEE